MPHHYHPLGQPQLIVKACQAAIAHDTPREHWPKNEEKCCRRFRQATGPSHELAFSA